MELHQLEALLSIVETGSFRAASEKLNKAQSAISLAIKNLEDELGFALFDRSTYRPQLTLQGRSVIPQVKSLLQQYEYLKSYGNFLKKGHEARIVLGVANIWPQQLLYLSFKILF